MAQSRKNSRAKARSRASEVDAPAHDHGVDADLQPDDYEEQFEDAPATGFEPREDEVAANDNEPATDEAARDDENAGAGNVAVHRRGLPD